DMAQALGGFLERRGRRAEALKVYDAALVSDPGDASLAAARARAASGGPPPPQPTLAQAAGEALIAPAGAFAKRRQPEIAVIYLRLSLRLDPADAPAWVALGDALNAGDDVDDAVFAWRQVRPDQPDYAGAAGRLAVALQAQGDKAAALSLASTAARDAPDDTPVQVVYAELLRDAGRNDEAAKVADRLVKALPPGAKGPAAARLYFLRGSLLERAGRWREAEPDLEHAVQLQPDDPEMLNYLGFALADRGERLPQALAMLEKAAAAAPQDGAIADSVGWARFKLGDVKGAVRDLERAVSLAPADPDVNDHLGDAYARAGRRAEAAFQWRRVLTLDPDPKLRAAVEAKLKAQGTANRA
ncbi:MAG: tetratricopeptide repeat protein, partial [Caulobacteraceae bacterium]|nr:tetratricopeptide repeat protein [Caulobacter sp.]